MGKSEKANELLIGDFLRAENEIIMFRKFVITSLLCGSATAASAEFTYGNAFAKYHSLNADGGSADIRTLGAGMEYRYNSFTFSGEFGRIYVEGNALDSTNFGFGYTLSNGVTLGLDYSRFDLLGQDVDITSAFAMLTTGEFTLGASIGEASEIDEQVYSIFGAWDVTPTGTVGLDIVRVDNETLYAGYVDYDLERFSVQADLISTDGVDVIAASGAYSLGYGMSLIGSLGRFDLGGAGGNAITIGGQYEFSPGANIELAVGRISVDGADSINLATFGLSYEMGRRSSKRRTLGTILTGATGSIAGLTDF